MFSDTKMTGLEEVFENVFSCVVHSSSFRLPMSVKELRLLTERICRDTINRLYNKGEGEGLHGFWGDSKSSTGSSQGGRRDPRLTPSKEDVPIGLNSLSKTFNIIQIVGQGNFGKVFKAENKFDHRIFAIKQIKINPKEDLDKVLQEVENLSKVGKNKNVVKYLDCFLVQEEWEEEDDSFNSSSSTSSYFEEDSNLPSSDSQSSSIIFQQDSLARLDKTASLEQSPETVTSPRVTSPGYSSTLTCLCIKMEFCDFTLEQLLDLLRSNRPLYPSLQALFKNTSAFANFKENKANSKFGAFCPLYIIYQLLDGLIFIHNLGIVHRDLKPANIFIMQDGKVKIGDFGLSKDLSKESGLSKMYAAGTRFYMAPEFLGGLSQPSRKAFLPPADMYSLGMVILRLLGHVDMEESELFRINDKIRQNPAREIKLLFRRENLADIASGTTKGNLASRTRPTHLPLLMDFLEALMMSLLAPRPSSRLTALQAKLKATHSFNQIFSGDTYFRPKIGGK